MSCFILPQLCANGASLFAQKCALKNGEKTLSYSDLNQCRLAFAQRLTEAGVGPGTRVIIALENSFEYVIALFATLTTGATAVPTNPDSTGPAMMQIIEDCAPRLLIARQRTLQRLSIGHETVQVFPLFAKFPDNLRAFFSAPEPSRAPFQASAPADLAFVLYTSGTTGRPKGVMLSHENLLSNTFSIIEYLDLKAEDSIVNVLPFFYSFGNSILLTHLAVGATVVIENGFMFPAKVVETMQKERPTGFSGVPSTYYILLGKTDFLQRDWKFLRYITQAGGGMRAETIARLRSALPYSDIHIMYGQTEASARLTHLPPEMLAEKLGSVGIGIPGVEIRVVDEQGAPVRSGIIGEITARGPNIMMGYFGSRQGTNEVIRNGWLHTGDMARLDDDGFIYIVNRKSDFIKSGSYRVSPVEIESVIAQINGIEDVAAIGTADDLLGEAIVACVSCPPDLFDSEKIRKHCLERLPFYKVPKYILHEPDLPRTSSGKKKYGLLRQKYSVLGRQVEH